jgi:hypothetical protein
MEPGNFRRAALTASMAGVVAGGLFFAGAQTSRVGAGTPADKVTVAGSTMQVVGSGQTATILSATMKTSAPEDLVLQVTAECSIVTQVFTSGTAAATASGEVDLQAFVDSNPVPIVSVPGQNAQKPPTSIDDGRVVFCDRVNTQNFLDGDSTSATAQDELTEYQLTKQTNGFNWAAFNVGQGTHTVSVKATFCTYTSPTTAQPNPCTSGTTTTSCTMPGNMTTCADAIIGNRTFIVTPTSLALNQTS